MQVIEPASTLRLPVSDLRGLSDSERELRAEAILRAEAAQPFDLRRGPLLRVHLLQLADDDSLLLLTMHHIVADGWSVGVFMGELSSFYRAFSNGVAADLPPLTVQYADYAAWQRARLGGQFLEELSAYWTQNLQGAPERLELTTDGPRPAQWDNAGASVPVELDAELVEALRALARRHGSTLYLVVLSAWAAVLGRLSGQDEVVVGSPVAGRSRVETEPLIGFFVNTLPLRLSLAGEPAVGELLGRARRTLLAAQAHQELPFEQIIELVQPVRSLSHAPLFQVMLSWQTHTQAATPALHGLQMSSVEVPQDVAKCDLSLELSENEAGVAGLLTYASALFEAETVKRFVGYLGNVLAAMVCDDAGAVTHIPLLDQEERRRLLVTWNDTARAYPREEGVAAIFEQQVTRAPDAIAIENGSRRLRYRELNELSNRIAHALLAARVAPGDRVAIVLGRSLELVAAEDSVCSKRLPYTYL